MTAAVESLLSPQRLDTQFGDIGELGHVAGWDLRFRQLDPGRQRISARLIKGRHIGLVGMEFNRGYHQIGVPPQGTVAFGVPLVGSFDWYSRTIEEPGVLNFNDPSGIDGVSRPGFRAFALSIEAGYLRHVSESFDLPVPDRLVEPRPGRVLRESHAVQGLRRILKILLEDVSAPADEEAESAVVVGLLSAAVDDAYEERRTALPSRSRALKRAMDFIEARPGYAIKIGEVCRQTGSSWRTLDYAFKERFGIGPKAYILRRQLSSVRKKLLAGDAKARVTEIARAWGFWHMGQFSRDYRRMFGELPSATLKRRCQ